MNKEQAIELLKAGVASLREEDSFKRFLAARAQFHAYSFHNILMFASQRPTATRVAGYAAWQELGRQVRKGEKGIAIFAPLIKKGEAGQEADLSGIERKLVGFRVVHIFDVSQTEGAELPEGPRPDLLSGDD